MNLRQYFALRIDRGMKFRTFLGERMTPPGLSVALQENVVAGVQENDLGSHILILQIVQQFREGQKIFCPSTGVDADRQKFGGIRTVGSYFAYGRLQQAYRQVVNTVVAQILQNVERDGFAGPRKATDNNQPKFF